MMHLMNCCSLLLLTASTVFADFTGQVVSVLDGDTIEVLHNNHPERIRLSGIDCPEKGQAYGNNAKHAASDLSVRQTSHAPDLWQRQIRAYHCRCVATRWRQSQSRVGLRRLVLVVSEVCVGGDGTRTVGWLSLSLSFCSKIVTLCRCADS